MAPTILDLLQFYSAGYDSDDLLLFFANEIDLSRLDEAINRQTLFNTIIDKSGSSYTAYDNLAALKHRTQTFFDKNEIVFNRLWNMFIDDRNYKESHYNITEKTGNNVRTPDLVTQDDSTITPNATTETTTGVSAYNEDGYSNRDRTTTTESGSTRDVGKRTETGSDTHNYHERIETRGYDGNPEELYSIALSAERDFNFYDYVAEEFDYAVCLGVF